MGFSVAFSLTLTFYTQQWEEYHAHVLRTFIGWFGVTEGTDWYSFNNLNIGILLTLSILLMTGATSGEFPYWTLGSIITFVDLPDVISNMTVFHLIAMSALYK